jgi:hypothetical protein
MTTPDGQLATGNPRLKLIGHQDYAAIGLEMFIYSTLRDGGLVVSLAMALWLFLMAWKGTGKPTHPPMSPPVNS